MPIRANKVANWGEVARRFVAWISDWHPQAALTVLVVKYGKGGSFMRLSSILSGAIAVIAIVPALIIPASAQVISSSTSSINGQSGDQGVTVYYQPDGAGSAVNAVAIDDTHAENVGWVGGASTIGADWLAPGVDVNGNPLPESGALSQYNRNGTWVYDASFFVNLKPGATQEALQGLLLTDDYVVKILLNGQDVTSYYTEGATPTWQNASTFDTSSYLSGLNVQQGLNTLEIQVNNIGDYVTGLAYNFSVVPVVPEPGIVVFGLMSSASLAGLMLRGRIRFKNQA